MSDIDDPVNGQTPDDLLAAEYALGVLAGAERSLAEQRISRDLTFANLVAAWEQRLAPWAAEFADVAVPPQVWDRIAAALPAEKPQAAGWWQSLDRYTNSPKPPDCPCAPPCH